MDAEDIFNGKEPEIEVVDTTDKTEEPTGEVEAKDESKDESKEETKEEVSSPDPKDETKVPLSAMHGERDRRKTAEKERDELKAQLEEKTPLTSVFEDENKFRQEVQDDFNQSLTNQALNQSEFFVADKIGREVLDKKIEAFKTLVETNPEIRQRFANAVSPYHELVSIVDQHDELAKMEDLPAYKATLKAEAKAEVKAELVAEGKAKDDLRESIPDSLTGDTSAGGLTSKDWGGPAKAKDVYG